VWGPLTHGRILGILKNPSHAGAYVFGRYQSQRTVTPSGEVHARIHPVAIDAWRVCLKGHHEAYITWEEFLHNQEMLAGNQTTGEATILSGPSREGLALLHGLLLCGTCGRRLTVRYRGSGGIYPTYECNWLRREGLGTKACMAVRCDLIDRAVAERVLTVLQPAEIELALEALRNMEARDQAVTRQWQMRIERAEYEAQLAEKRYQEVDPANRLVAATLERRWNETLQQLEDVRRQYAETERREARALTPGQKAQVLALAQDFPRLWNAPSTQAKDRKRMLRLLIQDITVERPHGTRQALLHVRWHGGAYADITVRLPPPRADQVRYPPELVQSVRGLACELDDDGQIAERLNQEGLRSATGKPFNASMVQWIRYRHRIPKATLRHPEELTVKQVAEHFGVSSHVVYYWIEHGILTARQLGPQKPYWVMLEPIQEQELWNWVRNSCRIQVQLAKHSKTPL
jgi:hypothetical protein